MATLLLCGSVAYSQGHLDAYRYGQSDLIGTARYLGMGGAFGSLGGDISAMRSNPAGLAIYRSSEVVTTLSLNSTNTNTNWLGNKSDNDKTKFSFDNIAYVGYFPTGRDEGVISWNAGFAYNRVKNFNRNYSAYAGGGMRTSISDYLAVRANGLAAGDLFEDSNYNPYNNVYDWLSVLGYNAGFIDEYKNDDRAYYSPFGDNVNGNWRPYEIHDAVIEVRERGSIDEYDLSFGMNISDLVMLGATVTITDINYNFESDYDEFFEYEKNDLYLSNGLSTDGSGYGVNVGVIVRPIDQLRFGIAYNSPTWYKMSDYYYGEAGSSLTWEGDYGIEERVLDAGTPSSAYTDYEYRSPDKWLFSASAILGTSALISVDYQLTNYKNMRMYDHLGNANRNTNEDIQYDFGTGNSLRVGAEVRVTPQFSVRAGGAWSTTPLKADIKNGDVEVHTVGTIPHFTLDKGSSNYSIGIGYRFTPNFYTDIAGVFSTYKEDLYAFSNMFDEAGALWTSQPATLKTKNTRIALTLGYKF